MAAAGYVIWLAETNTLLYKTSWMHVNFPKTTVMAHQTTLIPSHTVQQIACNQLLQDNPDCLFFLRTSNDDLWQKTKTN